MVGQPLLSGLEGSPAYARSQAALSASGSSATKSLKAGSSSPFYSSALQPWTLKPSLKAERNTMRMFLSYIPSPAVRPLRLLLPS